MFSIPSSLVPAMAHVPGDVLFLALLVVSLALVFAGGTLAKVVAFMVMGLVGVLFGFDPLASTFAAAVLTVVGLWVQMTSRRRWRGKLLQTLQVSPVLTTNMQAPFGQS